MPSIDVLTQFEFLYWLRDRALAQASALPPDTYLDPGPSPIGTCGPRSSTNWTSSGAGDSAFSGEPTACGTSSCGAADYPDVATLADDWQRDEADTLAWLSELSEADLSAPNTENGLEGFPLSTYLVQS